MRYDFDAFRMMHKMNYGYIIIKENIFVALFCVVLWAACQSQYIKQQTTQQRYCKKKKQQKRTNRQKDTIQSFNRLWRLVYIRFIILFILFVCSFSIWIWIINFVFDSHSIDFRNFEFSPIGILICFFHGGNSGRNFRFVALFWYVYIYIRGQGFLMAHFYKLCGKIIAICWFCFSVFSEAFF